MESREDRTCSPNTRGTGSGPEARSTYGDCGRRRTDRNPSSTLESLRRKYGPFTPTDTTDGVPDDTSEVLYLDRLPPDPTRDGRESRDRHTTGHSLPTAPSRDCHGTERKVHLRCPVVDVCRHVMALEGPKTRHPPDVGGVTVS